MGEFTVLSLFSGIGGLDLGLERAGMTVAGQVEIDPWCRRVLAKHWPEVPRHDDVRTAAEWWGGRDAPDLVAGGFPCQPVSLAGKGLAQADSRWLWPAFADVIRELRPRYVLVENVPGLLGRGMGDVLGDLAAIGYDAEWDCVPAAFVGAPHIRNRVWIVAYPAGSGRMADGSGREHQPGGAGAATAPRPGERITASAIGLPGEGRSLADADGGRRGADVGDLHAGQPDAPRRGSVADAEGQRGQLRQAEGERPGRPASGRADVADADGTRSQDRPARQGRRPEQARRLEPERLGRALADSGSERRGNRPRIFRRVGPAQCGRWPAEPDVGRVASRLSAGMDGDLNAHEGCLTQARTTGLPRTERLRALQDHLRSATASPGSARCGICGHPLSAMPCRGACAPWYVGQRTEEAEDLRCLREGLLGLLAHQEQDVLAGLPVRTGTAQRPQTMEQRVDRLRGLGNAVVPQVAEHIGRLIIEAVA